MRKRVVTVKIPAGVHEGQAVRITGEGEAGENGAPAGDLHCYIAVKPHPIFTRHNNDLVCQIPISFTQAALGAKIEVPTLKGTRASWKFPPARSTAKSSSSRARACPISARIATAMNWCRS